MNKQEFLSAFQRAMDALGVNDQPAHFAFFDELFDDMSEEGVSESEISARLGDPWELAASLLREEGQNASERKTEALPETAAAADERSVSQETGGHKSWEKKWSWRSGFLKLLGEPGKLRFDLNIGSHNKTEDSFETRIPISEIEELEINWRAGELEIRAEDREDILLMEERDADDPPLRSEIRGNCLCIFYAERICGSKDLTILFPTALAAGLRRCVVNGISADVALSDLDVQELTVNTVSGSQDVRVTASRAVFSSASGDLELELRANEISANTASGDMTLTAENSTGIKLSTASGDIECRGTTHRLTLNSASGDVEFSGSTEWVQVKTASGDCELELDNCPAGLEITSVSGDVDVELPEDSACHLQLKSRSGDVSFSGIRTDVQEAPVFRVQTVSGDIGIHD